MTPWREKIVEKRRATCDRTESAVRSKSENEASYERGKQVSRRDRYRAVQILSRAESHLTEWRIHQDCIVTMAAHVNERKAFRRIVGEQATLVAAAAIGRFGVGLQAL